MYVKIQLMMLMKIVCNIFHKLNQDSEDVDPRKILEAVKELPKEILKIPKRMAKCLNPNPIFRWGFTSRLWYN